MKTYFERKNDYILSKYKKLKLKYSINIMQFFVEEFENGKRKRMICTLDDLEIFEIEIIIDKLKNNSDYFDGEYIKKTWINIYSELLINKKRRDSLLKIKNRINGVV